LAAERAKHGLPPNSAPQADSTRILTQDDPAPQTVYRVETGPGEPAVITVRLRYR
jgi:hypothetical protein